VTLPIVVYGASGTAGAAVAAALVARGAHVVLVGRDRARLRTIACQLGDPAIEIAALHDPSALHRAFRGARVVVGCAGPFGRGAHAAVAAALEVRAHWIDIARDQNFLRTMYEEHDAAARRAGRTVVSGLGVEGALGDWTVRCAASAVCGTDIPADASRRIVANPPIHDLAIGYAFEHVAPAPGSQQSWIATLTAPGVRWRNRRWDPDRAGARARQFDFGVLGVRTARSFPSGEIVTTPRHIDVASIDSYATLGAAWAMYEQAGPLLALGGGVAGRMLGAMLAPLVDPTRLPTTSARTNTRFAVVAQARRGAEHAHVRATGIDIYRTTAVIVAEAALALATRDGGPTGVLAPSQAFGAAQRLRSLAHGGVIALEGLSVG